jgi:hypothetical protein
MSLRTCDHARQMRPPNRQRLERPLVAVPRETPPRVAVQSTNGVPISRVLALLTIQRLREAGRDREITVGAFPPPPVVIFSQEYKDGDARGADPDVRLRKILSCVAPALLPVQSFSCLGESKHRPVPHNLDEANHIRAMEHVVGFGTKPGFCKNAKCRPGRYSRTEHWANHFHVQRSHCSSPRPCPGD